jgi:choline kinase
LPDLFVVLTQGMVDGEVRADIAIFYWHHKNVHTSLWRRKNVYPVHTAIKMCRVCTLCTQADFVYTNRRLRRELIKVNIFNARRA